MLIVVNVLRVNGGENLTLELRHQLDGGALANSPAMPSENMKLRYLPMR